MSDAMPNPYLPPLAEPKLSAAKAADIRHRDIAMFVLLNVVTLGLYWFYIAFRWAKELNGLQGRAKYQPAIVLLVIIFTCGIAGMVFECLYAFDIDEATRSRGMANRNQQLPMWVIVCNCASLITAFIPFGIVVAIPIGVLASVLVQVEFNKLADVIVARD